MAESANLDTVSATDGDRVLSGVGVDVKDLEKVMARHAPAAVADPPAPAGETPPPAEPPAAEPPAAPATDPKPTRGQKRFDQLTAEREEANRAADAARQEAADLKERLAALERQVREPQVARGPVQPPAPTAPQLPPLPQFPPYLQTYDAFLQAFPTGTYDDWQKGQLGFVQQSTQQSFDATIRQHLEADRASRSFEDRLQQTWSAGREVYPDFEDVRTKGPGAAIDLDPRATQAGQRSARIASILNSPQSAHLQYAICKDADLARRLAAAPDDIAFGQLLATVAPGVSVASPASTGASGSVTPPPPYQPVGSGSKMTSPSSADLVQGFDYDASGYRERRAAERGVTRRR